MNTQQYRKVTVVYGNVKSMVLPDQSRGALVYLNGRYRFFGRVSLRRKTC